MAHPWIEYVRTMIPSWDPWFSLGLFFLATGIMIFRFEALEGRGFQGTVLGTLIMPYCSGISNLIFAWVMGRTNGNGSLVIENCMVNNVTNLTLLLGLPAIFWGLDLSSSEKDRKKAIDYRVNRLSLSLTIIAVLFFTALLWALTRDGRLDFNDGVVLIGVFLFWQTFHVFDVLKDRAREKVRFSWKIPLDLIVILGAGYAVYISIERLVAWMPKEGTGFLEYDMIGWLSGILMVLPNALLAFYYASRKRADIVYSSQIGDGHICIPMCIGLFAVFKAIDVPEFLDTGILLIAGSGLIHFFFIVLFRRLPSFVGAGLVCAYGFFLYKGFFSLFS